jgi:hypothetical protein
MFPKVLEYFARNNKNFCFFATKEFTPTYIFSSESVTPEIKYICIPSKQYKYKLD